MSDNVNRRKSQRWVSVSKGNYDGADWDSDYSGEELESSPTRQQQETICKLPELPKLNLGGSVEEKRRPASGEVLTQRGAAEVAAANIEYGALSPASEVHTPRSSTAAHKLSLASSSRSVSSMNKELDSLMQEISKEMTAGGPEPPLVEPRQSPVDFNRVGTPALKQGAEGQAAGDSSFCMRSSHCDDEDAAGESSPAQSFEHLNMSLKTDAASDQALPLSSPRGSSAFPSGRNSIALQVSAASDRASKGSFSSQPEDRVAANHTKDDYARLQTANLSDDDTDSLPELITSDAKFSAEEAFDTSPGRVPSSGVETVIHRTIAPEIAPRLRITSKTDLSYRYDTSSEDDSEAYSGIEEEYLSYEQSPTLSDPATFHGDRSRNGSPTMGLHTIVDQEEHSEIPVISDDEDNMSKTSTRDATYYGEESDNTTSQALVTQDDSSHDTIRERSFDKSTSGSLTHSIPANTADNEDWQNQLRQQSVHLGAWNPDTEGKRSAFLTQASPMSTNRNTSGSQDEETTGDDQQLGEPSNDDSDSVWEGFPSVGDYEDLQSVADIKTIYDNQTLYNVPGIMASNANVPPLPTNMSEMVSRHDTSTFSESTSGSGLDSDSLMRIVEGQRHAPKPSMFKENFGQSPDVAQIEHAVNIPVPSLDICALIEGPQPHSFKREKLNSHLEELTAYSSGAQTWIKYALKSTQSSSNITFDDYVISKHVQDAYAQAEEVSKKHSVTNAVNQNVSQLRKKVFSHSMKEGAKGLLSSIGKKKL
ncbi:AaceriACR036Cp [[Ashbya] aceris (nom. inval.)]|nr:AaceriACR036Cp [[Ashbya] aceris (nom. inval.)]